MYPPPPRLQPALFGGLFIGVLSALPLINLANCCCLWVIGGGVLATYLMQQNHPFPIAVADGALVGLMAGLFGGVLWALLSIPIDLMMRPFQQRILERVMAANPDFPDDARAMIENMSVRGVAIAFKTVFSICIGVVFGMLGGLLGVAMFRKKDVPPPGTAEVLPPA